MNTLKYTKVNPSLFGIGDVGFETTSTFAQPLTKYKYIKILSECVDFRTTRDLFPGVAHPICKQLRDLCRAGYLDRYILQEPNGNPGPNPYYYKTTPKGAALIFSAVVASTTANIVKIRTK